MNSGQPADTVARAMKACCVRLRTGSPGARGWGPDRAQASAESLGTIQQKGNRPPTMGSSGARQRGKILARAFCVQGGGRRGVGRDTISMPGVVLYRCAAGRIDLRKGGADPGALLERMIDVRHVGFG